MDDPKSADEWPVRAQSLALYSGPVERDDLLFPFLHEGIERGDTCLCCMYDLQRFGLDMLVAVLKTHPMVLLDRTVLDNPHYLSQGAYHAELAGSKEEHPLTAAATAASPTMPDLWSLLTASELRIAGFVAKGLTNKDIAQHLYVSPHTVDAHLKHLYTKLDIHSRVELTVLAMQHRAPVA